MNVVPKEIYATDLGFLFSNQEIQENSSSDSNVCVCFDMRLKGPMLRKFLKFEDRFLVRSGSRSWKEFKGTAVALGSALPILCSMVENGDSMSPNTTPLGKSPRRTFESPGIKSAISSSGLTEPVHANS